MSKNKLPKVKFPIEIVVNSYGRDRVKTIHIGDEFPCPKCGQPVYANSKSVFMFDDIPYITCTNVIFQDKQRGIKKRCGYKAFALYYIEAKEKTVVWKTGWKGRHDGEV